MTGNELGAEGMIRHLFSFVLTASDWLLGAVLSSRESNGRRQGVGVAKRGRRCRTNASESERAEKGRDAKDEICFLVRGGRC